MGMNSESLAQQGFLDAMNEIHSFRPTLVITSSISPQKEIRPPEGRRKL